MDKRRCCKNGCLARCDRLTCGPSHGIKRIDNRIRIRIKRESDRTTSIRSAKCSPGRNIRPRRDQRPIAPVEFFRDRVISCNIGPVSKFGRVKEAKTTTYDELVVVNVEPETTVIDEIKDAESVTSTCVFESKNNWNVIVEIFGV